MKRYKVIKNLLQLIKDNLLISNIGDVSKELFYAKDRPENFYMLGSMGLASSIGLGLSLSLKGKIFVLDGDGSVLMNLGSLTSIARYASGNLCLIIFDNKAYGSTGYQATATSGVTGLADLASASGIDNVKTAVNISSFCKYIKTFLNSDGLSVIIVPVEKDEGPYPLVGLKPVYIKNRFVKAILGDNK